MYDLKRKQKAAVFNWGQANFRGPGGLEAKHFKNCPRGQDILEGATSATPILINQVCVFISVWWLRRGKN